MSSTRIRARQCLHPRGMPIAPSPLAAAWLRFLLPGLAAVLLSACATNTPWQAPVRDQALIHVRLVDHIDYKPDTHAYGLSRCANDVCVIEVLRAHYPYCLGHELRHVFEGDWHAGRESMEGC